MDVQKTWMLLQIIRECGNDPAFSSIASQARKELLTPAPANPQPEPVSRRTVGGASGSNS